MRTLLAQLNPTVGNFRANTQKILSAIETGKSQNADIVLFSELALTGYPPEDFLLHTDFLEETQRWLDQIIQASAGIAVVVGLPRQSTKISEKVLYNSAAVISNGSLLGYQDKILLPTYDVFDERRYFEPGRSSTIWTIKGKRIAVTICEDIWQHGETLRYTTYQRDPIQELMPEKPDLLLNLSASPFHSFKSTSREEVCAKAAQTLQCPLILCNQVGANDSLIFDGYSLHVGADGLLRQHARGFGEELLLVDLSKDIQPQPMVHDYIEDLYHALVLGVRDYFHKQGFKKACLGLSGGIDSALVACIAAEALGAENVLGVLMPSRYSSPESITDAIALAQNLGMPYKEISIEDPFNSYLNLLTPEFDGKAPDATEENIQARIRGMILMALSNKHGYIVLSTGNKSELAMGYSTLYGDLCGGLAVISDVTKGQVYSLSKWINRDREIIPENTIVKPPSAELRPNQKDSDSLPDYAIIDATVQDYVEEHLSAADIAKKRGFPLDLVEGLIKRIHANEYKRRQSPPGLRVTEKAFSVGRRFPIVQKHIY